MIDNYEWHENYRQEGKLGLFHIYYNNNSNNQERSITKGATALKLVIEESRCERNSTISERALSLAKDQFGMFNSDGSNIVR